VLNVEAEVKSGEDTNRSNEPAVNALELPLPYKLT
jgi:hypothetical protein